MVGRGQYYQNSYYEDPILVENPPPVIEWDKLYRSILDNKPKVTR